LIEHFLQKYQQRYNTQVPPLPADSLRALLHYRWPGNVRELANRLERYVLLQDPHELVASVQSTPSSGGAPATAFQLPPGGLVFEEVEKSLLLQALQQSQGNKTHAAKLLHLPYKAFLYRLEKFGLDR